MAGTDRIRLPFRWEFVPLKSRVDGPIQWKWRAYTEAGAVALESEQAFQHLTECMTDAREQAYERH